MMIVAHLYCVSLAFRLAIGGVSEAISSGLMIFNDQWMHLLIGGSTELMIERKVID